MSYEDEYRRIEPLVRRLSDLALVGKKLIVKGNENFVAGGPNLIVGNHIGTFKDVAAVFKISPRILYPTGNRVIFDREEFNLLIRKHLQRHLHNFGVFLDLILTPIKTVFVNFISSSAYKIGAIPVDLTRTKRLAIEKVQDYLKLGRAVVILQGRGRVMKNAPHPYVSSFRRGPSIITYNLLQEGLSVPVTPIALFGTHRPFMVPGKIRINIGPPMYISDFLAEELHVTINRFREEMEKRVKTLFYEICEA